MSADNYFKMLGIARDADDDVVKQAFRDLAKNCHPDLHPGNVDAEQQFKRINTAYEALKDADRRAAYIEWLAFAEKRERAKETQWTRLGALVLLLVVAPAAVLYWVIWGIVTGDIAPQQKADRPQQIEQAAPAQPAPGSAPRVEAAAPAQPAANETVVQISRDDATAAQPHTTATVPQNPPAKDDAQPAAPLAEQKNAAVDANGPGAANPPSVAGAGENNGASAAGSPAADAPPAEPTGVSQFSDCEDCPVMGVLPTEEQRKSAQFQGERNPVAVSLHDVSAAEWGACVAEGGCPRPGRNVAAGDQPMINLTPRETSGYVDWLSRKSGKAYRLVTSAEPVADAGETDKNRQAAERYARLCNSDAGWEWLDDVPEECTRLASQRAAHTEGSNKGFRVARVVTWTPE